MSSSARQEADFAAFTAAAYLARAAEMARTTGQAAVTSAEDSSSKSKPMPEKSRSGLRKVGGVILAGALLFGAVKVQEETHIVNKLAAAGCEKFGQACVDASMEVPSGARFRVAGSSDPNNIVDQVARYRIIPGSVAPSSDGGLFGFGVDIIVQVDKMKQVTPDFDPNNIFMCGAVPPEDAPLTPPAVTPAGATECRINPVGWMAVVTNAAVPLEQKDPTHCEEELGAIIDRAQGKSQTSRIFKDNPYSEQYPGLTEGTFRDAQDANMAVISNGAQLLCAPAVPAP